MTIAEWLEEKAETEGLQRVRKKRPEQGLAQGRVRPEAGALLPAKCLPTGWNRAHRQRHRHYAPEELLRFRIAAPRALIKRAAHRSQLSRAGARSPPLRSRFTSVTSSPFSRYADAPQAGCCGDIDIIFTAQSIDRAVQIHPPYVYDRAIHAGHTDANS